MARSFLLFRRGKFTSRGVRAKPRSARPLLESLERRDLLASFTTLEDMPLVVSDPSLAHAALISAPAHGRVSFTDAGGFTYTPNDNYNGSDAFVYGFANTATGTTLTGTETAAITIKSVNDAPTGANKSIQVSASTAYALQPSDFGFSDPSDHPANTLEAVQIVTLPVTGKLVDGDTPIQAGQTIPLSEFFTVDSTGHVSPSNRVRYLPDATSTLSSVNFAFAVQDNGGAENGGVDLDQSPNLITIYVAPAAQVVARPDYYGVAQDASLTIPAPGLLGNDTGINGRPLMASLEPNSGPQHGTLELHSDGSFTYKPAAGYVGTDSFIYRATDVSPLANPLPPASATAMVTITVRSTAPIVYANNDVFYAIQNTPLGIAAPGVLKNDVVYSADATNSTAGSTAILNLPLNATLVTAASHGTLQLAADGSFTYVPAQNFYGADTFTYRATLAPVADGTQLASNPISHAVATVTIYVKPLAPAVVANNDTFLAAVNGKLDVPAPGVLINDYVLLTDPTTGSISSTNTSPLPSYPLMAVLASNPASGTLDLHSDGSFHYVPNANFAGTDSFTYLAVLNSSATTDQTTAPHALATVTINVKPVAAPPQAFDDSYSTAAGTTLKVAAPGVIANDTKADGATLAAVIGSKPAHGDIEFHSDGSFSYTPVSGFTGTDTFTYQDLEFLSNPTPPSSDPNQYISNVATVTINVKPIVTTPIVVANNDSFDDVAGVVLDVPLPGVLKNDYVFYIDPITGTATSATGAITTSPPTFPLSAVLVSPPASGGTVDLHPDGSFHYVPKDGFTGSDTFTYRAQLPVTDPQQPTASDTTIATHDVATVTINVRPVIVTPVAKNDEFKIDHDMTLIADPPGVLANDLHVPDHKIVAVINSDVSHGTLNLTSSGGFTYTPAAGYFGVDSFTYYDVDTSTATTDPPSDGLKSNVATVTIYVTPPVPPSLPVAVNDYYLTAENTTLGIGMPGVLANDYITPSPQPLPPVPVTGTMSTVTPIRLPLTAVLVAGPVNGSLVLNVDGSFKYVPNADFVGTDTFTYQDSEVTPTAEGSAPVPILSNIATVTIHVVSAIAHNDSYATDMNTALDVAAPGVLKNDAGGSTAHPLTATLLSGPLHGTLLLNAHGQFHYEPAAGYIGVDTFSYRATDGTTTTDPATGAILATAITGDANRPINAYDIGVVKIYVRPPATSIDAHDDKYLTPENTALMIASPGVLANDYGPVNVPVIAALADKPAHGTVTLDAQGGFTYTPDADFVGADKFTYSATVATLAGSTTSVIASDLATVTIYVAAPNATPGVILGGDQTTTDESGPQTIADYAALLAVDPSGAPPTITVSTDNPNLFTTPPSIDPTGQLVYTPAPNAEGAATITITVGDPTSGNGSDTATFTIQIDKPHEFSNTALSCDVTDDSTVAADDALSIINYINAHGSSQVSQVPTSLAQRLFYDVDKDNWIAAIDVLLIINYINAHPDQSSPASDASIDPSLLTLVAQDTADATIGKKKT